MPSALSYHRFFRESAASRGWPLVRVRDAETALGLALRELLPEYAERGLTVPHWVRVKIAQAVAIDTLNRAHFEQAERLRRIGTRRVALDRWRRRKVAA